MAARRRPPASTARTAPLSAPTAPSISATPTTTASASSCGNRDGADRTLCYGASMKSYGASMKKEQVKAVLDRVLTWPPERQEQAVRLLSEMEQQDAASLSLSDDQLAEVKRRLADPNPKFLTLREVRERFA